MADLLMKMPVPYEPKRQNRFILRFPSSLGINDASILELTKRINGGTHGLEDRKTKTYKYYEYVK